MSKTLFIFSLLLSFAAVSTFSQTGSITGMVTDSLTGQPVANLSVFIPSTTIGTTTNQKGDYRLDRLAPGDYTLMFRHVSYPVYSRSITVEPRKQVVLNLVVSEKSNKIKEVVIVGKKPDWNWAYQFFKEYFLGDPNESKCVLKNPQALSFYFDGDVLTATSKQPLEIENRHLGYRVTYFLDYFKFVENKNPEKNSVQGSYFAYAGSGLFKDLSPVMPLNAIGWKFAREAEFKGSIRHFLSCLYQKKLMENRYYVRKVYHGFSDLQETDKLSTAMAKVRLAQMDSIFSWYPESGESGYLYYFPYEEYEIQTLPDDAFLLVFKDFKKTSDICDDWISTLRITGGDITFDQNGNYWVGKGSLRWTNHDNTLQIRVILPSDYMPKTKPVREEKER